MPAEGVTSAVAPYVTVGLKDPVADHLAWTDFEVEAKAKNLASGPLARHVERWAQPEAANALPVIPGPRSGARNP